MIINTKNLIKLAFAILATVYFFYYLSTPDTWHFIDNANLIIHEAGHWIFSFFGMFMYVLGGSLLQVLLPFIFVLYFIRQEDYYSAALCLFWVAINFVNVSIYAGDSVKMQLPLLGGDSSTHDWNWLLIYTGQLHHTEGLAMFIKALGIICALIAAVLSIKFSFTDNKVDYAD